MDRGTKIYAVVLALVTLALAITFLYESPKVSQLNNRLQAVSSLQQFPYHFKVMRVEGQTAIVSSPRSTEVPVSRILGFLFPAVKGLSPQSDEFQQAQKILADHQILAQKTILSDSEISQVSWQLDRSWLMQHGISF